MLKRQFIDIIEYIDPSDKILVCKYDRPDNEIKEGAELIVREGQCAIFLCRGQLADIFGPGNYTLSTGNLPILSTLEAFPYGFHSPIRSDLYFISLKQFMNNKWATKRPIIRKDKELNMVRIRSFGKFSFAVTDAYKFMLEVFGTLHIVYTYDIINHLSSLVSEAFGVVMSETEDSVLDITAKYQSYSKDVLTVANEKAASLGLVFTDIMIESISLPEDVEKMIDEHSGIGLAKNDMGTYMQYETIQAMRDAAKQKGGLAGLGASAVIGNTMVQNMASTEDLNKGKDPLEQIREYKKLLDEQIITQEEFNKKKKELLDL